MPKGQITTSGGRTVIDHIYPNSAKRFIEDLGKKQRDFSLIGIIQGPNYFAKKRAFLRVLEEEGPGTLVHPFFGRIDVVAKPYSLVEDFTKINIGTFELTFSVPSVNIFPTSVGLFNVSSFSLNLNISINSFINTDWLTTFSDTLAAAENTLNQVYDIFDDVSRKMAGLADNISTFKRIVQDARDNIPLAVSTPQKIYDSFNDSFSSLIDLSPSAEDTVNLIATNVFGSQSGNNTLTPTTEVRSAEINNDKVINQAINSLALSYAYQNASLIDYKNDQILISTFEILETQFLSIIDTIDSGIADNLYKLRDEFRSLVDNLLVTVDKVITISTNPLPLLILGYQNYGSTDKHNELIELNNILNPTEVSNNIKVLAV